MHIVKAGHLYFKNSCFYNHLTTSIYTNSKLSANSFTTSTGSSKYLSILSIDIFPIIQYMFHQLNFLMKRTLYKITQNQKFFILNLLRHPNKQRSQ